MKTTESVAENCHQFDNDIVDQKFSNVDSQEEVTDKISDHDLAEKLDDYSFEAIVEIKISRFLDQVGTYYPENMYDMIMKKVESPLIKQILLRTGGNQVHAARILGINRNTLRKKMKMFGL